MDFEDGKPWTGKLLGVHRDTHPHWVVDYGYYAVTLRCQGSLSKNIQLRLREIAKALEAVDPASEDAEKFRRRHFSILENALDQCDGFCPFLENAAAQHMMEFLDAYHADNLAFEQWVIMPNHLHLITMPMACHDLDDFIYAWRRFKSRSARSINEVLGRSGPLWQSSWYDRWIRSSDEWHRWSAYLMRNPVKAGLCDSVHQYPYCRSHSVGRQADPTTEKS